MPLSVGDKLGPYEILGPIGAGGMGEVWKARDARLDRIVAIKTSKAQFSERFAREAKAIAALNHPHICQLYDVGPDYLVMEYVEGSPLKGPLPTKKAIEYATQILSALDAAYCKGIIHCGLKPANILFRRPRPQFRGGLRSRRTRRIRAMDRSTPGLICSDRRSLSGG
jgi:serine/threonine protein kinase